MVRFIHLLTFLLVAIASSGQQAALFDPVNSSYDELSPVVSPDGRLLFFTRANHPSNVGGVRDPGDIWFSVLTDANTWSAPVHADAKLNDRSFNAVAGFSADGSRIFLMNHFDPSGATARTQGLSVSVNGASGWSRPQNITIPFFRNESPYISGEINPDETIFVYAAEAYGSVGVEDIYVTLRNGDGSWGEARNLGRVINTPYQEQTPFLSADTRTLYFSSNGRRGAGSFDVYSSARLDDTWQNWSEPENLGPAINTEGRDLYYHFFEPGGYAYFTTTKDSDGYGDIRKYQQSDSIPVILARSDTVRLIPEPDTIQSKFVNVFGRVVDVESGQPVKASLLFKASAAQPVLATVQGYSAALLRGHNYEVSIQAEGYISALENLDLEAAQVDNLEMNFKLQPVAKGATVRLKNVLFEQGKTELLPDSYDELDLVVEFMNANPRVRIQLTGHTDNRGSGVMNLRLSQDRVEVVRRYIISRGISGKRVDGKGYGGAHPIASNDTEETRRLNRRVEFTITKD